MVGLDDHNEIDKESEGFSYKTKNHSNVHLDLSIQDKILTSRKFEQAEERKYSDSEITPLIQVKQVTKKPNRLTNDPVS